MAPAAVHAGRCCCERVPGMRTLGLAVAERGSTGAEAKVARIVMEEQGRTRQQGPE